MSNPETTRDPLEGMNLSGLDNLGEDDARDLEADELAKIEADGKFLLWEADELPPPENVAFSLRLIANDLSAGLEAVEKCATASERIADAAERLATAVEALTKKLDTVAAGFGVG